MTAPDDRRQAVRELAQAIRALNAAAVLTEVSVAELRSAAAAAVKVAGNLGALTRTIEQLASIDDLDEGTRMFNPVSGEANLIAPTPSLRSVGRAIGSDNRPPDARTGP